MLIISLLSDKIRKFCDIQKDDPLLTRLRKKYPDVFVKQNKVFNSESNENDDVLCFNDDWDLNFKNICTILEKVYHLKERYNEILGESKENDVYFKTIDNLIKRLNKIKDKSQDACKISEELSKAIQATIMKNYSCKQLATTLNQFMNECGFKRVELKTEKLIEDEDLDYIQNCVYCDVNDKKKHNTIIDKAYDSYVFRYYDSDEKEYYNKVIPGVYIIGRWKE